MADEAIGPRIHAFGGFRCVFERQVLPSDDVRRLLPLLSRSAQFVVPKTPELRYPIPTGIETASRQQSHGSKYTTWAGVVAMRCSTEGVPRFGFQMIQLLWILDLDGLQPIAMASNQLAMASNLMQLRYCSKDTMHFSLMLAPGFAFQTKRAWIRN